MVTDIFNRIFGNSEKRKIIQEDSFDVEHLKELIVTVDMAEVAVITHELPRVDIKLESYEGGPVLETTKTEDTLTIIAKKEQQGSIFVWGNIPKCKLQIHVPADIADNLELSATSGKIALSHFLAKTVRISATSGMLDIAKITAGKITLNTTSGKIKANELKAEKLSFLANSGMAEIHSSYGDIQGSVGSGAILLTGAKGEELELKAGSGKIVLKEVYMKNANVRANSGKIVAENFWVEKTNAQVGSGKINFRDFSGSVKANANSGNITISVSENTGLDLKTGSGNIHVELQEYELNNLFDIKTGSGDIVTNLPMRVEHREKHHVVGKSGNGDYLIRIRTGSGNARLYTAKLALIK